MRNLFVLFILFISCERNKVVNDKSINIVKNEKKTSISSDCSIINRFPKISNVRFKDSALQIINAYFENVNELNLNLGAKFGNSNGEIIGDYIILSDNDSLITFEFFVKKGENITSYKPVFFDKKKCKLLESDDVVKNISRSKLRYFITRYNHNPNAKINMNAYEDGIKTKLSYANKGKILYLYAGDEGEFGGKYKIEIPLDSVLK